MKQIILLAWANLLFASAFPYTFEGKMVDANTGEPLYGATIFIKSLNKGTTTNPLGVFQLHDIPEGNYLVQFNYLGYQSATKTFRIHEPQRPIVIELLPDPYQLQEIRVQADAYKELAKIPTRIDLVTSQLIAQSSEESLADILGNLSGVQIDNTLGMFSSNTTVSLRGVSGSDQSRTLVILDGIPLNKSDGGSVNWNVIDKDDIETIKVIKGPAHVRYGSNAMGGVIDITTKRPAQKLSGRANVSYGTYNTMGASLQLAGKPQTTTGKGLYWSTSGSAKKSDGYIVELEEYLRKQNIADSIIVPVYLQEINTQARVGYNLGTRTFIELTSRYFDDLRGNGMKVFEKLGDCTEHDTWTTSLQFSHQTKRFSSFANLYYLFENYYRVNEYMKEGEYKWYYVDSDRKDLGGQLDFSYMYKRHNFSFGASTRQGSVAAQDVYYTQSDIVSNAGSMYSCAAYVQDELQIEPLNIQLLMGLRYDHANFNNGRFQIEHPSHTMSFMLNFQDTLAIPHFWHAWSPKLSVQKHFAENTRWYLSYGKGFKAPLLDDLCRSARKNDGFRQANPMLEPEYLHNFETGIDFNLTARIRIKQSAYHSIGKDFMYLISTGDTVNLGYKLAPVYVVDNISKVQIQGYEFSGDYQINDHLSASVNYTYNISRIKDHQMHDSGADENLTGKYLTNIPRNTVSAAVSYHSPFIETGADFKYVGWRWITDLNDKHIEYELDKFPAYTVVSLMARRKLVRGLYLKFSVNNVFNTIYMNSKFQRCPGRFITGEIQYKF